MGCEVVGVDGSAPMITAARGRPRCPNRGRQTLAFSREFDAVFQCSLHWMQRGADVIDGVWRALKPGGRFVGEFGGRGNVAAINAALNAAHAAAAGRRCRPGSIRARRSTRHCCRAGLSRNDHAAFSKAHPLPGPLRNWLDNFAGAFLADLAPSQAPALLDEVVQELRRTCSMPAGPGPWITCACGSPRSGRDGP
jgi:SAM-dependent methyltransferase